MAATEYPDYSTYTADDLARLLCQCADVRSCGCIDLPGIRAVVDRTQHRLDVEFARRTDLGLRGRADLTPVTVVDGA